MDTIQVSVRNVYGKPTIYPANERAEQFAALIRAKTFSHAQLEQIAALGFKVEQVADYQLRVAA